MWRVRPPPVSLHRRRAVGYFHSCMPAPVGRLRRHRLRAAGPRPVPGIHLHLAGRAASGAGPISACRLRNEVLPRAGLLLTACRETEVTAKMQSEKRLTFCDICEADEGLKAWS